MVNRGLTPDEIAVFVRSEDEIPRAVSGIEVTGTPYRLLSEGIDAAEGSISVSIMHLAKGLEFRAVAVIACDDEVIPSQSRIESIADEEDLEEV